MTIKMIKKKIAIQFALSSASYVHFTSTSNSKGETKKKEGKLQKPTTAPNT